MYRLKRLFARFTKTLPKQPLKVSNNVPKRYQNDTITLASSNKISDFPLRVFVIIGKQGVGKTTLCNNLATYYKNNKVEVVRVEGLNDLDKQKCVLIIDDLRTDLTRKVFEAIIERFRVVRHYNQIIILTHHLLNDVPTKLLQLSDKVIMFHTNFSVNSATSKIHHIIPKSKKHDLHELVLSLKPFEYVIVKNGVVYGVYDNYNIQPIISDTKGNEISLLTNQNVTKTLPINDDFIKQQIPEYELLTVTAKIIVIKQKFPLLKPMAIARVIGTTPLNVRKTLSIARKKGLLN